MRFQAGQTAPVLRQDEGLVHAHRDRWPLSQHKEHHTRILRLGDLASPTPPTIQRPSRPRYSWLVAKEASFHQLCHFKHHVEFQGKIVGSKCHRHLHEQPSGKLEGQPFPAFGTASQHPVSTHLACYFVSEQLGIAQTSLLPLCHVTRCR